MTSELPPTDLTEVETLLPDLVRTLVKVIGLPDTMFLVGEAGGTSLAVPRRKTPAGEARYEHMVECFGSTVADKLTRHFGGESLYIPRCQIALTEYTYRQIRREFDRATAAGRLTAVQAVSLLARTYHYSDRRIWSILKMTDRAGTALRPAAGQLDLFIAG